MKASGAGSVMASRREPPDSLDDFPTPPPATRGFLKYVLPRVDRMPAKDMTVWEPACNRGFMAEILAEQFGFVFASDIFDYGYSANVLDFTSDFGNPAIEIDWIITNPPFNKALEFARRALPIARRGVALILRTVWLEGGETCGRYPFFQKLPPHYSFVFSERMPMLKARWEPKAKSATSYTWFVWINGLSPFFLPTDPSWPATLASWIPPVCRTELTLQRDVERFAVKSETPLLEAGTA